MKKKILAALMAVVMLFTILPLGTLDTAWAEERASATAGEGSVSGGKLLEGYLYRLAGMDIRSYENGFNSSSMAATYSAKANLNAEEQSVYNTLKAEIEKIASGQRKDTNIKTTGVLGSQASADKVWHALLSDLPYELYWHDKVIGINYAYTLATDNTPFKDVTFSFAVAQEFRGKDMTTTNIPNVPAAVQTARSVVAANASKSDHDKLQAYRQYICDQVSYNYAAARGEYANSYGNPWQLLWVFDGDSTTNVVCEGYAKSFKYLCDLTEESNGWTGDVETINVTGTMGTENHMWNIVRIGGGNYLVDVTNCDTGMKGYPQKLFLRGAVGDGISYTVENTVYTYGTETRTGFAAADLKLSGTDYTPAATTLTAPTVTLKADAASGQPVVSWTKVNGAAQYEVYRSTNGKNFSIVRRTAALSYTDTSAAAGTTYYYQVRAINGSVKSAFCPAQSIQYAVASLNAPTMTLTSAASGQPVVSWTKVNGAAQYEVYRSTNGKNFSIVRRTAALSYTDTSAAAGTTYYYQVRAINGSVKSDFCPAQSISLTVSEYGGECGSRATWRLTDDGVLTISGKDGIYEYGWYGEDDVYHPAPWAEEGVPAVKKLVVNSGITYIGSSTFEGLDQLTSVSLPDTMEYIGWGAFSDCASLTSIVVPEGIKVLYANTFARCTSLRSVKLPSTLEWINDCIFSGCTSLQDIVLPEGIDYIPWRMFDGCTSLRSVTIPGSIMSVSNDAFSGCTALTSVIFGGSRTDWENMTFNTGNDALRRVTPTCTGSTALAAPVVTGSTDRSGMPLVQWNKVSGAAKYQLWCSRIYDDFGAVAYDLHADWDEEWFWDGNCCSYLNNGSLEDGVTYSYKVRAVDANGNVGAFSKEIRITFEPVLATPVISVTTNAQYQPVLAWDKVSGAGYYEVWRWCEEDETDQCIRRTAGLTWTDTTAELGKTYWYYLRAYSPDWNFTTDTGSYYSAWGYSMRWDVLDTPEITEVYSPEAGKAVLGWTKVSGADQYEIYRSTDGENYSIVRRTAALTWTDTTVQSGRVYYKIRAVVNVGSAKGYSDFLWTNFFVR